MNDIKNNLKNKGKLEKIISNVKKENSVITGTIESKEQLITQKDKGLQLLYINKSNNISNEEILSNTKIFINDDIMNKICISNKFIYCTLDTSQTNKILNICIEIRNALMKKITDMSFMFYFCNYISLYLHFNTENVKNMDSMFLNCKSLVSLPDISNWNTKNVKSMKYMFSGCNKLRNIPKWYKE